jgi:Tir chaperone protein (CesT) family
MTPAQQQLNEWLQALGHHLGLTLSLDDQGQTCLECKNNVQVFVEVPGDAEVLCLYSPMLRLPPDQAEQNRLLKQALQINLFSLETGAACLAFDSRTDSITLTFAVGLAELDAQSFAEAVGDFIELSVELSARLLDLAHGGPAALSAPPPLGQLA